MSKDTTENTVETVEEDRAVVRPYVAIREDDVEYVLRADVPGVSQDGVNVTVENDVLTLEASTDTNAEYSVGPRALRTYRHTVRLNERVDSDGVKGKIRHGVLVLHLPKRKELAPRKIDILAA